MKIKEVIKETGLTDRAIRLYIENDLVKPECDENYNGRKSIDFSETDVANLKNIALLRKADFSIQEIKALQMGGETAQQTVKDYIKRTNEKIQFNTEIIEKIGTLADEENITIETICEKLSTNLEDEKVPIEDMKAPVKERVTRTIFMTISIVGLILSLGFILFIVAYYQSRFLYPVFYEDFFDSWVAVLITFLFEIQFILCYVILTLIKKKRKPKKKKEYRYIIAFILSILWMVSWLALPHKITLVFWAPPVYSQTTNPIHYLRFDADFYGHYGSYWRDDICEIFPVVIPDSATIENDGNIKYPETTKYYYKYEACVEAKYDLFAEWILHEDEFKAEKERILGKEGIISIAQKGDWQCVYFTDNKGKDMFVTFFAYNDTTQTVRYISMSDIEGLLVPYYTTQEW